MKCFLCLFFCRFLPFKFFLILLVKFSVSVLFVLFWTFEKLIASLALELSFFITIMTVLGKRIFRFFYLEMTLMNFYLWYILRLLWAQFLGFLLFIFWSRIKIKLIKKLFFQPFNFLSFKTLLLWDLGWIFKWLRTSSCSHLVITFFFFLHRIAYGAAIPQHTTFSLASRVLSLILI